MNSDIHNDTPVDRDAFDELIERSTPVEPGRDDQELDFISTPETEAPPPAPSIPRLRKDIKSFQSKLTRLRDELAQLDGKTQDIPTQCREALAAVASDQRIPADDPEDPTLRRWRDQMPAKKLLLYRGMALEEIDAQIEIATKALVSLQTLDAFDKPALSTWSNLPPQRLARAINGHAHLIFSSAIVR